jgi:hypothetical protein
MQDRCGDGNASLVIIRAVCRGKAVCRIAKGVGGIELLHAQHILSYSQRT